MPEQEVIVTDLLVNMFFRQMAHVQQYGPSATAFGGLPRELWGNLDHPQVQATLREFAGYITEELYEGVNLLKNKPWKHTPKTTDPGEFYKEMGDFWHFVVEFMIYAGMTPDKVQKFYFQMAEKNDDRRKEGY